MQTLIFAKQWKNLQNRKQLKLNLMYSLMYSDFFQLIKTNCIQLAQTLTHMVVGTPWLDRCFLTNLSVPYQLKWGVEWPIRGRWTEAGWAGEIELDYTQLINWQLMNKINNNIIYFNCTCNVQLTDRSFAWLVYRSSSMPCPGRGTWSRSNDRHCL